MKEFKITLVFMTQTLLFILIFYSIVPCATYGNGAYNVCIPWETMANIRASNKHEKMKSQELTRKRHTQEINNRYNIGHAVTLADLQQKKERRNKYQCMCTLQHATKRLYKSLRHLLHNYCHQWKIESSR